MQKSIAAGSVTPYAVPTNLLPKSTQSEQLTQKTPLIIDGTEAKSCDDDGTETALSGWESIHVDRLSIEHSQVLWSGDSVAGACVTAHSSHVPLQKRTPGEAAQAATAFKKLIQSRQPDKATTPSAPTEMPSPESPSLDAKALNSAPPAVKVLRDMQRRVRSVHMRDLSKTFVFQFDSAGDLISLEVQDADSVRETTSFAPSGMPVSKEIDSVGFNQVTTFDRFGRRRTQRTLLPGSQENVLFASDGSFASQVRQTSDGYELYTMRSDGSSLHQSDNYKHYSRHETKPDGSSYNVLIHKTSRVSARCWFHPTAGTHELIESPTEIVETKRDLNGEVVSRSNNCKKMSRAISCTANEVITIG